MSNLHIVLKMFLKIVHNYILLDLLVFVLLICCIQFYSTASLIENGDKLVIKVGLSLYKIVKGDIAPYLYKL